jgi:M6 family metalloprotease-like protein
MKSLREASATKVPSAQTLHTIRLARNNGMATPVSGIELMNKLGPAKPVPSLQDFGFESLKVLDFRYLLVIKVKVPGGNPFEHTNDYYNKLIFNLDQKSINSYYNDISCGRFHWEKAREHIIATIELNENDMKAVKIYDPVNNAWPVHDHKFAAKVIERTVQLGYDFGQMDTSHNGITEDVELGVLIISNMGEVGGNTRWATKTEKLNADGSYIENFREVLKIPGFSDVLLNCSAVSHRANFTTIAHELCHQLGSVDMYGDPANNNMTLMGATIVNELDEMRTYHLDPWHKMRFGWNEPRIRSIRRASVEQLSAANTGNPHASIILYDPAKGPSEFFILEYRTASPAVGTEYDRDVAGSGLAIWHYASGRDPEARVLHHKTISPQNIEIDNSVWHGGEVSQNLIWANGRETGTKIFVRRFAHYDTTITIEIIV